MFVHYKKEIDEKKLNLFKNDELNKILKKLKSVYVINSGFDGNNIFCLCSKLPESEILKNKNDFKQVLALLYPLRNGNRKIESYKYQYLKIFSSENKLVNFEFI